MSEATQEKFAKANLTHAQAYDQSSMRIDQELLNRTLPGVFPFTLNNTEMPEDTRRAFLSYYVRRQVMNNVK